MGNQKMLITKGSTGYTIKVDQEPSISLDNTNILLKMEGNEFLTDSGDITKGYKTIVPFYDSSNVRIEMEVKRNRKSHYILELIGSEDFRDSRAESVPDFLIHDRFVAISIEDTDNPNVKNLVFTGH